TGCLGFFMPRFAMNNARDRVFRVLPDALPNAHYVAAGGIDKQASFFFQLLPGADFRSEGGNNHQVLGPQLIDFVISRFAGNGDNSKAADLIVNFRVMNDFAEQKDSAVRVSAAGSVSKI